MLNEFKDFWKEYLPYQLHPKDYESLSYDDKNDMKKIIHFDINQLIKKFNNKLKLDENNKKFESLYDLKAIHSNMFCKSFIGNVENSKIIILYGNPGLKLGDYKDEHFDTPYIDQLKKDFTFSSNSFVCLEKVAKNTGGYNYWKRGKRFSGIIKDFAKIKNYSYKESFNIIKNNICILQSIGYHSTKTPYLRPSDLPTSIMNKRLVHEYFLPKANKGEIIIFSWRQSNFWNLEESENVIIRNVNSAINSYLSEFEKSKIVNFLKNSNL